MLPAEINVILLRDRDGVPPRAQALAVQGRLQAKPLDLTPATRQ